MSHRAPLSRREKTRSAKIDGIDCFAQTGYRTTVDAHRLFDFVPCPRFTRQRSTGIMSLRDYSLFSFQLITIFVATDTR